MRRGLESLGHRLEVRPLGVRTGFHTFDRWLYNAEVALRPPRDVDLVYGVDLDGFLFGRRSRRPPLVVSLKGIIADELRNERGLTRALLSVQARWERKNTERADLVIACSRYSCEVARREYGVPEDKLAPVPEPIDLAEWDRRFAAALRLSHPGPVVLCVARMYPRKRIGDLLEAAVRIQARIPGARIRIVGRGPEWESVERRHAALGLGETVTLLGDVTREALAAEYVSADLFCLPSVQEGFGIVFLEAMAAGLPVVACRAAAIPEVVEDGVTGTLVAPRDPEALAAAVQGLLGNPERRRAMREAGRRRVALFTPERVAAQLLEKVRWRLEGRLGP
ncbi:MAG TPA: glycosyltransferase family 4 protein [Candidatus Bathyarchaeia archaeon]|nr:glycosyltransferase family 4 protein [Candidatus Bathyarchaeia archaeon]